MVDGLHGLYVEDAVDTYMILRSALKAKRCTLSHAADRSQFLSEIPKPLDFVIFDGQIPGWNLCDYLCDIRTYCKPPFFVYSGSSPAKLEPFYHIGAQGVFHKAQGFEAICACICKYFCVELKSLGESSDPGHSSGM